MNEKCDSGTGVDRRDRNAVAVRRSGGPFCSRLRRGLAKAGIDTVERDIWADPAAAARVRSATGGDETVPTVIVGTRALVNPSVGIVVAAVRAARLVLAGTVGFAASALVTVGLFQAVLMRGPMLLSFTSPISEALVLAGAVVVLIVLAGPLKLFRTAGVD